MNYMYRLNIREIKEIIEITLSYEDGFETAQKNDKIKEFAKEQFPLLRKYPAAFRDKIEFCISTISEQ